MFFDTFLYELYLLCIIALPMVYNDYIFNGLLKSPFASFQLHQKEMIDFPILELLCFEAKQMNSPRKIEL